MDKIKIVVLVLIGGILLMSNARGQKQETEKELTTLKLVQQLYDAEKVKSGEKIKANFEIINTGKNNLYIEDVITSCGCTKYELSNYNAVPDEKINISVEIDTNGKKVEKIILQF